MADWAGTDIASVLAVRLDAPGDVVLTGPALRALARRTRVVLAVSGAGEAVAPLLPGVSDIIRFDCPWVLEDAAPVDPDALDRFTDEVRSRGIRHAVVFTSDHQSALPTALALRLAGVEHIAAFSELYPGSLLDVMVRGIPELHEVQRNLHLVERLGFASDADQRLAICRRPLPHRIAGVLPERYVVVHPGLTDLGGAPARTRTPERWVAASAALIAGGHEVVVTGMRVDVGARLVVEHCPTALDLVGSISFAELSSVIAHADVVIVGDTGAIQLAAAVGTPTVAACPSTEAFHRWRPWLTAHRVIRSGDITSSHSHPRECHLERPLCPAFDAKAVVAAVDDLLLEPCGQHRPPISDAPHAPHASDPPRLPHPSHAPELTLPTDKQDVPLCR